LIAHYRGDLIWLHASLESSPHYSPRQPFSSHPLYCSPRLFIALSLLSRQPFRFFFFDRASGPDLMGAGGLPTLLPPFCRDRSLLFPPSLELSHPPHFHLPLIFIKNLLLELYLRARGLETPDPPPPLFPLTKPPFLIPDTLFQGLKLRNKPGFPQWFFPLYRWYSRTTPFSSPSSAPFP